MPSNSERSFGQRYTKARQLQEYLLTIPTYTPGNPNLNVANFDTFLDGIQIANANVDSKLSVLQTERDLRIDLFKGTDGLINRTSQIKDCIGTTSTAGNKSLDYQKVQKVVKRMRVIRLTKKPVVPPGGTVNTNSTSEQSYGSMLGAGREVLEVIKTIAGYASPFCQLNSKLNIFFSSNLIWKIPLTPLQQQFGNSNYFNAINSL
ncbi:MAG: hypothetical protein IPJ03_01650 [Ignavibacteriales bacterium]|nr:hypothetical protein [Ignavibacteriales bacterium]